MYILYIFIIKKCQFNTFMFRLYKDMYIKPNGLLVYTINTRRVIHYVFGI